MATVDESASAKGSAPIGERRGRILVIDDDPAIAKAIARTLRFHDVTIEVDSRAALTLLMEDAGFDVILCDLIMPDMSGMALHAALAASHPDVAARIVFLTGGAFTHDAQQFLDSVTNPSLTKPFESSALRGIVSDYMNRSR